MEIDKLQEGLILELRRGTQILLVLNTLKDEQYGYSLLQDLEEKGIAMEAGTLYPLLRRLESQGLLESTWDTTESRPRKYYVLSPVGVKTLSFLKDEWKKIVKDMSHLVKEEK